MPRKKSPPQHLVTRARGRPVTFDHAVAAEVCRRMAEGASLLSICREEGMPPASTVREWVIDDRDGFAAHYTRARHMLAERWADEVLAIGDELPPVAPDGRIDGAAVQHQRLRVDSRKWLLSKVLPKLYGDRVALDHAGGVAITVLTGVPDA